MPSILLRNLASSCRYLRRAYAEEGKKVFPDELGTVNGGVDALSFFAEELCIGRQPLDVWRSHQITRLNCSMDGGSGSDRAKINFKKLLSSCSPQDATLLESAVKDLRFVVSPFVRLANLGDSLGGGSQFVASQNIPAGMLLMSIPTECALVSGAPQSEAGDVLFDHHLHIDDLAAQLWTFSEDASSPHHVYANYLLQNVVPPRNLPFMAKEELECADTVPIWEMFHKQMEKQPLNELLHKNLSPDEYLWFVSVVMSRRSGLATLIPVLDKLNHDPVPNAYFSMAQESSFCGLDLVDNIVAGVDHDVLFEPYIHLFAINPIAKGRPLTISYSDQSPRDPHGRDSWRLSWGFVPNECCVYKEHELREVAGVVVGRRVEQLSLQFPPPSGQSAASTS